MEKIQISPKSKFCPSPIAVVGTNVNGMPNYSTVCCNIMGMISITLGKSQHNYKGIKENGNFSINFPSEEVAKALDYCGLVSGKNIDKGKNFTTFYGELKNAPMIKEFPVNFECKVAKSIDFGGTFEMFVGEIIGAYSEQQYLTDGWPDVTKIKPILYSMPNDYWRVGEHFAPVGIGQDFGPLD